MTSKNEGKVAYLVPREAEYFDYDPYTFENTGTLILRTDHYCSLCGGMNLAYARMCHSCYATIVAAPKEEAA
jgi:hypothetical protein